MIIYGCSNNSKEFHFAQGILSGDNLLIEEVNVYENSLDLFVNIMASGSAWGLNFEFSIPFALYKLWGLSNWPELLNLAILKTQVDFVKLCKEINLPKNKLGRFTDSENKAEHILQKHSFKLPIDFYNNLKILAYLKQFGALVYPFDELISQKTHLYEVRTENLWLKTGLHKTKKLKQFVEEFNKLNFLKLQIPEYFLNAPNHSSVKAILACIVLAIQIKNFDLEQNWNKKPNYLNEDEWSFKSLEGLILRA